MKVALLVPGGVDRSGVDRVIPALLWLIERLAKRHTVHVFALRQERAPATWELLGARVHNIGTDGAWRRRLFATFAQEHRRIAFDLVHAFWGGMGAFAAITGWRHRIPVLVHLAGGELVSLREIEYGGRRTVRGRLSMQLATAGARRISVASVPMQELAARFGIASERIPLGVALDQWSVAEPRRRDPSRPARMLHVGDLNPVKDHRTLLTAAAHLRTAGVDFQLDLVGVDTMGGAVQRLAGSLGLDEVARFHGAIGRDALRALIEQADLHLVSSRHEAGPVAMLEAAVAGVPTVGTAVGHVAEWAPAAAVAVPVGDAVALARETAALLSDEPRRLALAHEAVRAATTCDADFTAARFEGIYHELVAERVRPAR